MTNQIEKQMVEAIEKLVQRANNREGQTVVLKEGKDRPQDNEDSTVMLSGTLSMLDNEKARADMLEQQYKDVKEQFKYLAEENAKLTFELGEKLNTIKMYEGKVAKLRRTIGRAFNLLEFL